MQDYYNKRAEEYERIYNRDDPIRNQELGELAAAMCDWLEGRRVLEVACGTGYWTERLAPRAEEIVATDASDEMLGIGRSKEIGRNVSLTKADAYDLGQVEGRFTGGLANFWFSHVPKDKINEFLTALHKKLASGAHVFMADNCFMPGVGGELITLPGIADTYKLRRLDDGSEHMILKNYYSREELAQVFADYSEECRVHMGRCFWWVSYVTAK